MLLWRFTMPSNTKFHVTWNKTYLLIECPGFHFDYDVANINHVLTAAHSFRFSLQFSDDYISCIKQSGELFSQKKLIEIYIAWVVMNEESFPFHSSRIVASISSNIHWWWGTGNGFDAICKIEILFHHIYNLWNSRWWNWDGSQERSLLDGKCPTSRVTGIFRYFLIPWLHTHTPPSLSLSLSLSLSHTHTHKHTRTHRTCNRL